MELLFRDRPLILSRSAMCELFRFGYDLYDALEILEFGYECSRSKRSKDIVERCIITRNKIAKVVAAKSYDYTSGREVWLVIHFGITSRSR